MLSIPQSDWSFIENEVMPSGRARLFAQSITTLRNASMMRDA
jgi:hypothetical protein